MAVTGTEAIEALRSSDPAERAAAERAILRMQELKVAFAEWLRVQEGTLAFAHDGDLGHFLRANLPNSAMALLLMVNLPLDVVREQGMRDLSDDDWDVVVVVYRAWFDALLTYDDLMTERHAAELCALANGATVEDARAVAVRTSLSPAEEFLMLRHAAAPRGAFALDPSLSGKAENARKRARRALSKTL